MYFSDLRTMIKSILIFGLLLYFQSLYANNTASWKKSQVSENEHYSVDLMCKHPPTLGGFLPCSLVLSDNSNPISNAIIKIEGGMPEHHHGLPTSPTISWDSEKEVHIINGLKFSMPGAWQLKFLIEKTDKLPRDIVTFNFVID
ncbi:FixH family protein [Cocleimonas sp. KMM 6892]|uniref:FixH family protein n=2 Tax=Cocleimonas TaxID=998014 RepID=UPI002DB8ADF1|nr:FixH family protein [Cocleimonas sp. KMM 6892]